LPTSAADTCTKEKNHHSTNLKTKDTMNNPNGKKGLWHNINAKQARIEAGSGERMRPAGSKGAPTAAAFKASMKTSKKK